MARLWGAFARERLPALGRRTQRDGELTVTVGPHTLAGPAAAAEAFARPATLTLTLDGAAHDDPAALLRRLPLGPATPRLAAEVDNSVANLALAWARQPHPDEGPSALARAVAAPDPLAYLEQCVVDGHPLHPGCRTRIGLSTEEVLAYAPEHRPIVDLVRVRVPDDRWRGPAPATLLVHPWQRDHVLSAYPWLRPEGEVAARPLMSLRTLALVADPATHIKTSVDVQMTSAVRIVSPAAIHNGPALSELLARLAPAGFTVIPEVAAGAVLVDGEPSRQLAMVRRRLPSYPADSVVLPFAVLSAPSPADGRAIVTELAADPLRFLTEATTVMLPPLLTLLRLGIALEAHGQNLLLVLGRGRPTGLWYRDLGGVRVSPARLRAHGLEAPPLLGDLVSDDPEVLRTKLFAAAVSTVLAELVATLARDAGLDPADGWARIAGVVDAIAAGDAADPGDVAALRRAPLPLKATTAMRLADDPLEDQWVWQPNPMEATG